MEKIRWECACGFLSEKYSSGIIKMAKSEATVANLSLTIFVENLARNFGQVAPLLSKHDERA